MGKIAGPGVANSTLYVSYFGSLNIADYTLPVAVLNNEERVFFQREIVGLLTGTKKGGIMRYFSAENLQPYIPKKFTGPGLENSVLSFIYNGNVTHGFEATDIIDICYMYINAEKDSKLRPNQKHLADKAHIIVKSFAKTGVIAVIDEVTGYQDARARDALQAILDKYLRKEYAAWAKTFPDEFYKEMFRLKGWVYDPGSVKRPGVIGKYTNDLIYERLAPGILEELQQRNPVTETGYRKAKHHQFLTEDLGHPALQQHLYAVITLMKAQSTWNGFYRLLQRALPKKDADGFQLDMWDDN